MILNILKDRNYVQILRLMKISYIGEFLILYIFLDVESIYNKGFTNNERKSEAREAEIDYKGTSSSILGWVSE